MTGIELIAEERARQIEKEGWTPEHDDEHTDESLALVAALYATPIPLFEQQGDQSYFVFADPWPESWDNGWDKRPIDEFTYNQRKPTAEERLRLLAKAGALIAAEIDRLQRAAEKTK
jgi:hypothetical protein